MSHSLLINLVFAFLLLGIVCYVVNRFIPDPIKTVVLAILAIFVLIYLWNALIGGGHFALR